MHQNLLFAAYVIVVNIFAWRSSLMLESCLHYIPTGIEAGLGPIQTNISSIKSGRSVNGLQKELYGHSFEIIKEHSSTGNHLIFAA